MDRRFLLRQAFYLCRGRWLVFAFALLLIGMGWAEHFPAGDLKIYLSVLSIAIVLNAVGCWIYRYWYHAPSHWVPPRTTTLYTHFHVMTDILLLVLAIHVTGGEKSLGIYLLIVYIAAMSLTYGEQKSVLAFSTLAALLMTGLMVSYFLGWLQPRPLPFEAAVPVYVYKKNALTGVVVLYVVALDALLYITAYLSLRQSLQLRRYWTTAEAQKQFYSRLHALHQQSLQHESLPKALEVITTQIQALLVADLAYSILWERRGEYMVPIAPYGFHEDLAGRFISGKAQVAFRQQCKAVLDLLYARPDITWLDLRKRKDVLPPLVQERFQAYETLLMLPLRVGGEVNLMGTLTLVYRRNPRWGEAKTMQARQAMEAVAPLVLRFVEHYKTQTNLRLLQELANDVTGLTQSLQVKSLAARILNSAFRLFNIEGCALLPDPQGPPSTAVLTLPMARGVEESCLDTLLTYAEWFVHRLGDQKILQVPDFQAPEVPVPEGLLSCALAAGWRAMSVVPIPSPRRSLGMMVLLSRQPYILRPQEILVAQLFAARAGAAFYNAHLYTLLREEALTDALTRLPNRRAIDKTLRQEWRRAQRYHHLFSVVMLDVNHFKTINDRFGHPTGDWVLQAVADLIRKHVRETDFVGRYGGDEFMIIFPETSGSQARQAMEKIQNLLQEKCCPSLSIRAGIAYGIATYPHDAQDPQSLIRLADKRLYTYKAKLFAAEETNGR